MGSGEALKDMIKLRSARSMRHALLFMTLLSLCDCITSHTSALESPRRQENNTAPYFRRSLQADVSHHSSGHGPQEGGGHRIGHKVVYKKVPYWKAVKKGNYPHPSVSLHLLIYQTRILVFELSLPVIRMDQARGWKPSSRTFT